MSKSTNKHIRSLQKLECYEENKKEKVLLALEWAGQCRLVNMKVLNDQKWKPAIPLLRVNAFWTQGMRKEQVWLVQCR